MANDYELSLQTRMPGIQRRIRRRAQQRGWPIPGQAPQAQAGGTAYTPPPRPGTQTYGFNQPPNFRQAELFMQGQDALLGNYNLPAPNQEHPMLGPQLHIPPVQPRSSVPVPGSTAEAQSGALQTRVPTGTQFGGGSVVAYREDGSPVLIPPRIAAEVGPNATNEQLMAAYATNLNQPGGNVVAVRSEDRLDQRVPRAYAAGSRGGAYAGLSPYQQYNIMANNLAGQGVDTTAMTMGDMQAALRARAETDQRIRRARSGPGMPQLPANMTDEQVRQSQNQRRQHFGVPGLPAPAAPQTEQPGGEGINRNRVFQEGFIPPLTEDGTIDQGALRRQAAGGLVGFEGTREQAEQQLSEQGLSWQDMRDYAINELYPGAFEWYDFGLGPLLSRGAAEERDRRVREYYALRKLDPTLPGPPENAFGGRGFRPPGEQQRPPVQRRQSPGTPIYEIPQGSGSIF